MIFKTVLLLVTFVGFARCSEFVPLLSWNNLSNLSCEKHLGPQGPGESVSSVFTKDYLECLEKAKPDKVFLFVYDKLGIEDFTTYGSEGENGPFSYVKGYLKNPSSVILPSVQPSNIVEDLATSMKNVAGDGNMKIINLPAFDRSTHSAIALGLTSMDKKIKNLLENTKGKYVVLLTSENSPDTDTSHLSVGRQLLATAENDTKVYIDGPCIYMVYSSLILAVGGKTQQLNRNPTEPKQTCLLSNQTDGNVTLYETYTNGENDTIKDVRIAMVFLQYFSSVSARNWWRLESVDVTYDANVTRSLLPYTFQDIVTAPANFSYACSITEKMSYVDYITKSPKTPNPTVSIQFINWQLQPFDVVNSTFSYPVDCVGWFSGPIWSGLIVALLMFAILACGLNMLSMVTTMDRFDDPKGKTISVPQENN